jgi:hypothetical protein
MSSCSPTIRGRLFNAILQQCTIGNKTESLLN